MPTQHQMPTNSCKPEGKVNEGGGGRWWLGRTYKSGYANISRKESFLTTVKDPTDIPHSISGKTAGRKEQGGHQLMPSPSPSSSQH